MTLAVALLLIAILVGAIIVFKLIQLIAHRKLQKIEAPNRSTAGEQRLVQQEPTLGKNPLSAIENVHVDSEILGPAVAKSITKPMSSPKILPPQSKQKTPIPSSPSSPKISSTNPAKFIVFYLKAEKDAGYSGYELLQTLLSLGLRYGKKSIFHRHEQKTGQGDVLFSLASAEEPGTFDLTEMGSFSTTALSLFFRPSDVKDPLLSYDMMLKTINELLEELGGTVLDEQRQKLSKEYVVKMRASLKELNNIQSN